MLKTTFFSGVQQDLQILFEYEVGVIVGVCVKEDLRPWKSSRKYFTNASSFLDLKNCFAVVCLD